jgi:MFS family permease
MTQPNPRIFPLRDPARKSACHAPRVLDALRERFSDSAAALRRVFTNRALRRVELARPAAALSVSTSNVVFLVVAFSVGGAGAVGTVYVARTLILAAIAPVGAVFGDRYPRQIVMAIADVTRAAALLAAALLADAGASILTIVALATVVAIVGTASAPARGALIPVLARTPEELTAANVVASTSDNLVSFVGPALGGFLLALVDPAAGFLFAAGASAFSGLVVVGVRPPRESPADMEERGRSLSRFALGGFQQLVGDRVVRLVMGIYCAQMLIGGTLAVLVVAAAADLLGGRQSDVGFLYSALGAGGFVGAAVALGLREGGLGRAFALGLLVWGVPLALVGAWPQFALAIVLFIVSGAGDSVVDVAGLTLLQRRIPRERLARVSGAAGTVMLAAATLGNVIAPFLIDAIGVRASIGLAGAAIPALLPLWWRPVTRLDLVAPPALPYVRAVPIFAGLPLPTLERLAAAASRVRVAAGEAVFRQGDPGDRFYVVVDGELEISVDGRVVETAGHGDHFGEIALLRDTPRTATVTAAEDAELYALERDEFLAAVSGQ